LAGLIAAAAEVGWHGGNFAAVDGESGEAFVNGAAGADTLDNFLAEIAAFFEVNAVEEAGFLNEVAIENFASGYSDKKPGRGTERGRMKRRPSKPVSLMRAM
jgi:hypothetical protein